MRLTPLVPIGFAAGAVLARVLLSHAPPDIAVDRMQPLVVVTYWQHFGLLMWVALFVAIAIASVGYVAALVSARAPFALRLRSGVNTSLRMTLLFSALACAAALAFPVVFSSDVYAYAGYGWLALHGVSPYAHAAITMRNPLMDAVLWQWGNPPPACVYGPAFVWFAQTIVALFGGLGPAAPLWALRISACAALVLCAPLAYHAFANFPMRTRLAAAAGIALNPVAIWSAAEGHNDAFLIAIVLAGFALLARSQLFAGALVLTLSALIKLPGLFTAAAAAAFAGTRDRARIAAGVAAGFAAAAFAAWPALSRLLHNVPTRGQYFPQFSLQYAIALGFGDLAAATVATALALGCGVAGCVLLWRHNAAGAPLLALALWIAIPNPYPWYALWILPIAFFAWETPAAWAIVALTLCTVARYLPDATTDLSNRMNLAIVCAELALPIGVFAIATFRKAQGDRMSHYRVHLVILATLFTVVFAAPRPVAAAGPPQNGWLESYAGPAPERGARLIFSGDSITAGYGVNGQSTVAGCAPSSHSSPCFADLVTSFFPGTIEVNDGVPTSCLEATTAARSICNVAYSGASPLITRYRKTMLPYAGRNRNWFFIHIGVNDLGSAAIRGDSQVNVATFKANYSEIVSALESAGTRSNQIVLAQITYSNATSPAMTFLFNSAIADVALKYHTRLSNAYRATALCNVPCLTDGTHPNNLGHSNMAAEDEQANFINAVSSEASYTLAGFINNAQTICRLACRLPLVSGTTTWKFGTPYISTPVCTATAEGAPGAGAPALFETISPLEVTVTSTLPTDNRSVDIRCEGQN